MLGEFNQFIFRGMRRRTLALAIAGLALAAPAMFATLGSTARSLAVRPAQKSAASIKTDKASYLAGDQIKISGAGFTPLESVMLQVKHANGTMENGMGHDAVWVYPGADGTFETTWSINIGESAGTSFVVTANSSSGNSAQTGFSRTATVAVNPFNRSRSKAEIVAGGFNPNELVTIRAGAASQTVRTDVNGRASVVADVTDASETLSVSAVSETTGLTVLSVSSADFNSNGWFSIIDSAYGLDGASCAPNPPGYCKDDVPLEKDLTRMGRNDIDATKYKVFMSWNSVTSWTGTGQSGNACALFSNRTDGKIQFAVCAAVENDPANPTVLRQVAGSPYAFTCSANKNDRCAQPTPIAIGANVVAGQFGTLSSGDLVTATDPFPTAPGDLDHQDKDTTLEIDILKSFLQPTGMDLVNVCSYPSAGNGGNNNPFDCIVRPSSGFLKITKTTTNATSQFTFDLKKGTGGSATLLSSPSISPVLTNAPNYSASSSVVALDLATDYAVYERSNTGWGLNSKSCVIQNVTTGTQVGSSTGIAGGVSGVEVKSGKLTECTFANAQVQPQLTLIKNVNNNNGGGTLANAWTLSAIAAADPNSIVASSLTPVANTNGLQATTGKKTVSINVTYALSESAVSGYAIGVDWSCDGGTFDSVAKTISLAAGADVTCQITNDDIQPKLTLKKIVVNDNGRDKQAKDFTLTATGGPSSFIGTVTNDSAQVVLQGSTAKQGVNAGTYTLGDSGPSGYDQQGAWSCPGKTLGGTTTSPTLALVVGDDITCTVTNNDQPGTVFPRTIQKAVLHDSVTLEGYNDPGAANRGTVNFRLYSNNQCTSEVVASPANANLSIQVDGQGKAATSIGVTVTVGPQYWWKITFSGDQYNAAKTGLCDENTAITFTNN